VISEKLFVQTLLMVFTDVAYEMQWLVSLLDLQYAQMVMHYM